MTDWLELLLTRATLLRALKYAVVVGTILVTINHGDALLAAEVDRGRWLRIGLTVLVPFCVSAFSSTAALHQARIRQHRQAHNEAQPPRDDGR